MSLVLKKLNEFADVISGYAFKSEWFGEGDSKVIRIGDLSNGKISIEDTVTIDGTKHKISENFKIKNNTKWQRLALWQTSNRKSYTSGGKHWNKIFSHRPTQQPYC